MKRQSNDIKDPSQRVNVAVLQDEVVAAVVQYIESVVGEPVDEATITAPDAYGSGEFVETNVNDLVGTACVRNLDGEVLSISYSFAPAVRIGEREIAIPDSVIAAAIKAHHVPEDAETDDDVRMRKIKEEAERADAELELRELLADKAMIATLRGLQSELDEIRQKVGLAKRP